MNNNAKFIKTARLMMFISYWIDLTNISNK